MEFDFERAEKKLAILNERENKYSERQKELNSMPWIRQIQQEEFREILQRVEACQRETFEKMLKRDKPELLESKDELFAEFFTELLSEKVKNMIQFMAEHYNIDITKHDILT